jgi:2-amino-4-hydroxy-6-hydroxymethyldihydropteridine diphosphokinase
MTQNAIILLGSNLGDRSSNLDKARRFIGREIGKIVTASSIYETAPWGKTDQPHFLNQVIEIECPFAPHELLHSLKAIEQRLGRTSSEKWGSRVLDLDILFYSSELIKEDNLTIPHPEITNRKFVLIPLNEIIPDFIHPKHNKTIRELLHECSDQLEVIKL